MENQEQVTNLSDLILDDKNFNKGTARGAELMVKSFSQFGAGRSVLLDKNNRVIAGNKSVETAGAVGIEKVRIIETMGDELIAVKRVDVDLDTKEGREMALADNATGRANLEFDSEVLDQVASELGIELADWDVEFEDEDAPQERHEAEGDDFDESSVKDTGRVQRGDRWRLGNHVLMCGDSTSLSDVTALMDGEKACCLLTDPPYNVNYEGATQDALKIANDNMSSEDFYNFLSSAFAAAYEVMEAGASFYVWFASSEHVNFRTALINNGLEVHEDLIWVKNVMVLGRSDYQWRHEPCQPAGTMVLTPEGEKPIESLKDGDRVISFDTCSGQVKGFKNGGYEIKTASRDYVGHMYTVKVGDKATKATDNHQFTVRFNPDAKKNYCTYLMRKGNRWRVGHTVAYDARQFGLKTRMHQEKADEGWLIDTYATRAEAQIAEQMLAVKYGIPYTHWEVERGMKPGVRTQEQIDWLYENLDEDEMRQGAIRILKDYGRSLRFPLIDESVQHEKFSTRVTTRIHACNLMEDIMMLPVPTEGSAFKWEKIGKVSHEQVNCKVYSLAVEKYEHYVSDGIITHNCLYGWKGGASHHWYSDRKQTTVLEFNKPARNGEHPTMKPVELFAYQMQNSSPMGGGSPRPIWWLWNNHNSRRANKQACKDDGV